MAQDKTTRKRRLQFFGIIINGADGLEKQILSGKICGTKSRGRQRTKNTDSLINLVTRKDSPYNELIRRTDNREDKKAMIADVCNRPGTWWWVLILDILTWCASFPVLLPSPLKSMWEKRHLNRCLSASALCWFTSWRKEMGEFKLKKKPTQVTLNKLWYLKVAI